MVEVFAGVVCGYGLALLYTPLMAIALVRARVSNPTIARLIPEGTSLIAASITLHTFTFIGFAAIGLIFGLMLNGFESSSPADGLGSTNRTYTAFTLVIVAIAVLPLAAFATRLRAPLLGSGLLFAGVFGWLMPYLSLLGD